MGSRAVITAAALSALWPWPAFANDPLSAIDWLENRPRQIVTPLDSLQEHSIDEPPVAGSVSTPDVTVTPLGAPDRASAGLLPAHVTGLPRGLWQHSDADVLNTLIMALDTDGQPALQALLYTLLLAEADAPNGAQGGAFMRTRVEKLLSRGALDPARALLDRAGRAERDLFDLYFDVALLSGDAQAPCDALRAQPALSDDLAQRIYCDVQGQEWDRAALTLSTADAIGAIPSANVALLERFLDPELFEDVLSPPPPSRPSALQFRLFEAIGEPLPTASLPRAFAATDLSGDSGWKPQIEAAERLAKVGAISENRLLGIYTSRIPSASGGVWDRVEAVQRLETAVNSGDPAAILKRTRSAWSKMQDTGLQVPFATLFAEQLLRLPATGADADLITRIALLSPLYEQAASRDTQSRVLKMAQSIATGAPKADPAVPVSPAIAAAFQANAAPQFLSDMAREGRLGEAILRAMSLSSTGAEGDAGALQSGLALLRSAGLEDVARRAALQHLLLDARRAR